MSKRLIILNYSEGTGRCRYEIASLVCPDCQNSQFKLVRLSFVVFFPPLLIGSHCREHMKYVIKTFQIRDGINIYYTNQFENYIHSPVEELMFHWKV